MADSTRNRLLAAAERILVEQGVNALSVRRIGDHAGLNPTLVTYHFKTVLNLLDELCSLNLDPILGGWRGIDPAACRETELDEVLRLWLAPMFAPAAFTPGGRALIVLDEIVAHGDPVPRLKVMDAMTEFAARLRATLVPKLPGLAEDELRARVRFISGAALGPPPRIRRAPPDAGDDSWMGDDLARMLRFARAALTG